MTQQSFKVLSILILGDKVTHSVSFRTALRNRSVLFRPGVKRTTGDVL